MEILFSNAFTESIEKHISIKKAIKKKVDMIIENPIVLGEPLKGNFRGYYSCSVRRNFLIIYSYCKVCRKKGDNEIVLCSDCDKCSDNTIKFIDLGPQEPPKNNFHFWRSDLGEIWPAPHNQAYGKK